MITFDRPVDCGVRGIRRPLRAGRHGLGDGDAVQRRPHDLHVHPDEGAPREHALPDRHRRRPRRGRRRRRPDDLVDPDRRGRRASSASDPATRRPTSRATRRSRSASRPRWTARPPRRRSRSPRAGKPVAGKVTFAEDDTVLVFVPTKALPYGAKVVMQVGAGARTQDGVDAVDDRHRRLVHDAPRSRRPTRRRRDRVAVVDRRRPAVGGGSWGSVETYYLRLMNCTRTGGWVTSGGSCSSPGGRNVARAQARPRHQQQGLAALRQEARGRGRLQPLHRRQPGRPASPGRLHELHLGREHRLPLRERALGGPRLASLLPEREVVQRRPLREPDEREVRPGRDRRLGLARPRPAGHRLLPPLNRTIVRLTGGRLRPQDDAVIRNVVIHINNEQPLVADLFEMPTPTDQTLRCTNLRTLDGKRPIFADDSASIFFFTWLSIRFLEILPASLTANGERPLVASRRRSSGLRARRRQRRRRAGPRDRRGLPPPDPRGLTARRANGSVQDPVLHSRPCRRTS